MKCFEMSTAPDGKRFFCNITDSCMNTYFQNVSMKCTWNIFLARVFNLEYSDFLRMVRDIYGATLSGKTGGIIYFYFTEKQMCERFIREAERKFNLWKKI